MREPGSLRLLENPAQQSAKAVLLARVPNDLRIDGRFTPDDEWVEMRTTRRAYLVAEPGPTVTPEPGRSRLSMSLWHVATRTLVPLQFPGDVLPWKTFWAPDDTSFAFLVSRDRTFELSLVEIRDRSPLAIKRLDEGRDLYDAWVSWQPRTWRVPQP